MVIFYKKWKKLQRYSINQKQNGAQFLTGVLGVIVSVTLLIVDLLQYCVCCIRPGLTWCTVLMVTWTIFASAGYTRCSGGISVHLCAASQYFYFALSVPLKLSC